jgi:hypothetical protein
MRSNQTPSSSITRSALDRSAGGRSEGARGEVARSEAERSDLGRSEAQRSDLGRSEAQRSDLGRGQAERSDAGRGIGKLSMPQVPVEWLDAGSWRLPSGKALAEFALQAGFLAPLLFRADRFGKSSLNGSPALGGNVASARGKQFGKGVGR